MAGPIWTRVNRQMDEVRAERLLARWMWDRVGRGAGQLGSGGTLGWGLDIEVSGNTGMSLGRRVGDISDILSFIC